MPVSAVNFSSDGYVVLPDASWPVSMYSGQFAKSSTPAFVALSHTQLECWAVAVVVPVPPMPQAARKPAKLRAPAPLSAVRRENLAWVSPRMNAGARCSGIPDFVIAFLLTNGLQQPRLRLLRPSRECWTR